MEWTQIILTAISTGSITALITLRARARKAGAEALASELANDDTRFAMYRKIIDDLQQRFTTAMNTMTELEEKLRQAQVENKRLLARIDQLEDENHTLRQQLAGNSPTP